MNMTYLDADTHEIIAVIDDTVPDGYETAAGRFAAGLDAAIERIAPSHGEEACVIELRIPPEVRQAQMPTAMAAERYPIPESA